jgi:hypothetical protein
MPGTPPGGGLNNVEAEVSLDAHRTDRGAGSHLGPGRLPLNGTGSRKLICMLPQALGSSGFNYGLGSIWTIPFCGCRDMPARINAQLNRIGQPSIPEGPGCRENGKPYSSQSGSALRRGPARRNPHHG